MACPLQEDGVQNLKSFIDILKTNPDYLHHPDLTFFKNYIQSLGGIISSKPSYVGSTNSTLEEEKEVEEAESEESEVELDYEGCIEPDNDPPQTMGYTESEVSEEDVEKSNNKKKAAIDLHALQKYEEAIVLYTEAILLNPTSVLLYVRRSQCYLQLNKPNACIRDCTRALEINPDNAAAYKFRGRAHRLLGNFLKAADDLRNACKIDFDEEADTWLKEVTPNARRLEEHERKCERKRLEKQVKETRERIRRLQEEQQKRAAEMNENRNDFGDKETSGLFKMSEQEKDLYNFFTNPEVWRAMEDPEVKAAVQDIGVNPDEVVKYKNNPKVKAFFQLMSDSLRHFLLGPPLICPDKDEGGPKKAPLNSDIDLD